MNRLFWVWLCVVLLSVNTAIAGEGDVVRVGETAPNISATATDGNSVSIEGQRGKVVVLFFFATWCDGCVRELPKIERELFRRYKDEGLIVIAVGRGAESRELADFKSRRGLSFPILPDPRRELYTHYATDYIPRSYLIGRDGTVKFTTTGPAEYDFDQLKRHVAEELARSKPRERDSRE